MSDWIDIKKQLPPKDTAVILANRYYTDYEGHFPDEWRQSVYVAVAGAAIFSGSSNVTHWMPLPAPPEI